MDFSRRRDGTFKIKPGEDPHTAIHHQLADEILALQRHIADIPSSFEVNSKFSRLQCEFNERIRKSISGDYLETFPVLEVQYDHLRVGMPVYIEQLTGSNKEPHAYISRGGSSYSNKVIGLIYKVNRASKDVVVQFNGYLALDSIERKAILQHGTDFYPGDWYYLSEQAGKLTNTPDANNASVGFAVSRMALQINITPPQPQPALKSFRPWHSGDKRAGVIPTSRPRVPFGESMFHAVYTPTESGRPFEIIIENLPIPFGIDAIEAVRMDSGAMPEYDAPHLFDCYPDVHSMNRKELVEALADELMEVTRLEASLRCVLAAATGGTLTTLGHRLRTLWTPSWPHRGTMMTPECAIVSSPSVNLGRLVLLCTQALGYSPAASSDQSHRKVGEFEKLVTAIAALRNPQVQPSVDPRYINHLSFSVVVIAGDLDLQDICELCSEMTITTPDTVARGIRLAFITGTVGKWRDAIVGGCQPGTELSVASRSHPGSKPKFLEVCSFPDTL